MTKLIQQICELKDNNRKTGQTELKTFIDSCKKEKLVSYFQAELRDVRSPRALGYVFGALTSDPADEAIRMALIEMILRESPKMVFEKSVGTNLIGVIVIEIDRLSVNNLTKLCEYCMNQLQKEKPDSNSWKELLPKVLHLLSNKSNFIYSGNEVTGTEYRGKIINSLCMINWKPDIIIMVADMFSEMTLSDEEMDSVLNKMYLGISNLEPSEVPPLVHQLLKVDRCCLPLLIHLQSYFTKKLEAAATDPDPYEDDISDGISHATSVEVKQSEGTVIYHIYHSASLGHSTIRLMLKTLRSLSQAPELIFAGHVLLPSSLLMIMSLGPYRENVLAILVTAACQALQHDESSRSNKWVRELIQESQPNLQRVFENIVDGVTGDTNKVLEQLAVLCFELMKKTGRTEKLTERIWSLASNTLIYIINKNRDSLIPIVEFLVNYVTKPKKHVNQFMRCFREVVSSRSRYLLRNVEYLTHCLVDTFLMIPPNVAIQSVYSLVPLLQLSEPLCNSLVIVLRKALSLPETTKRQMAVSSLLIMMQKIKVKHLSSSLTQQQSDMDTCSSYSFSQHTEVVVHGVKNTKLRNPEALRLELLQLLQQCFSYKADVKIFLYEGLVELLSNNEMSSPILQFLHSNFKRYRIDEKCPLLLNNICKENLLTESCELIEPMSHLIFAITQSYAKSLSNSNVKEISWFKYVEKDLNDVVDNLIGCSLNDFGFEEEDTVLDEGEKGSRKLLILQQVIGIYEALIAFNILMWSRDKSQGHILNKRITTLFNTYTTITSYQKSLKRPNKKKADTQQQKQAGPSRGRKRGRPGSLPIAIAIKSPSSIKIPPVLDLNNINFILTLLYNPNVTWANKSDAQHVISKVDFHVWTLKTLQCIIQNISNQSLSSLMDKSSTKFQELCNTARILYEYCINELDSLKDNDKDVPLLAFDAFREILSYLISNHKNLIDPFFMAVCNVADGLEGMNELSEKLCEITTALIANLDNEEEKDLKLPRITLSILSLIIDLMHHENKNLSQIEKLVQNITRKVKGEDEGFVKAVLDMLISLHSRRATAVLPLRLVAKHNLHQIGAIDNDALEQSDYKELLLINDKYVKCSTIMTCQKLKEILEQLNLIIQKLKCDRKLLPYTVDRDREFAEQSIKGKEHSLCSYIIEIIEVGILLTSMAVETDLGEVILRFISAIYISATQLTRHFLLFSSRVNPTFRGSDYKTLIQKAGKTLCESLSLFITHIEGKQKERYEQLQTSKRFNATVVQRKVNREAECVAKTILEMEKFSKAVMQLSVKTKIKLEDYLNMGISHDFRINSKEIQAALAAAQKDDTDDENEEEDKAVNNSENESNSNENGSEVEEVMEQDDDDDDD